MIKSLVYESMWRGSYQTKREFDRVMSELARFKREGGEFDGKVVRFKHWRRMQDGQPRTG